MRHPGREGGGVRALDNLTLSARPGEFLVLLGPSGSGKTTLLRLIAGLETPTEGRVEWNGQDFHGVPPERRNVAMVFQSPALFPHLTIGGNLELPLKLRGVPSRERAERVAAMAELTRVGQLLGRFPETLSGGQRQLVALGRGLILKPEILLLDEPFSSLDPPARAEMRRELKRLHRETGAIFVHVTHDQSEAMAMADRVGVLEAGVMRQVGTPRELHAKPATRFVARFIGEPPMNIFRLEKGPSGRFLVGESGGGGRLRLPEGFDAMDSPFVAIRPERTEIVAESDAMAAVVEDVEFLGRDAVAHCRCQGLELRALVGSDAALVAGDRVGIRFRPGGLIPLSN